jgi:hypothetical protein
MRISAGGWVVTRAFKKLFVKHGDEPPEERDAVVLWESRKLLLSPSLSKSETAEIAFKIGWKAREHAMVKVSTNVD